MTKPPWAAYIWCDARNVYLETPAPSGRLGQIVTLPLSEGGLCKAVKILQAYASKTDQPFEAIASARQKGMKMPEAKVTRLPKKDEFSEDLRAATRDVLRKMNIK